MFEPTFVKNLSFTMDYWSYDIANAISARLGAPMILYGCYSAAGTYCDQIHRNPITQYISYIDEPCVNVGRTRRPASTWPPSTRCRPTSAGGTSAHSPPGPTTSIAPMPTAGPAARHAVGTYDLGMYPSGRATPAWAGPGTTCSPASAGASWEASPSAATSDGDRQRRPVLREPQRRLYQRTVDFYHVTDLFVSYNLKTSIGKTNFGFGVNNLFNAKPSVIYSAFSAQADSVAVRLGGAVLLLPDRTVDLRE